METIYIAVIEDNAISALSFHREGEIFDVIRGYTEQEFLDVVNEYKENYEVKLFTYNTIEKIAIELYPELEFYDLDTLCNLFRIDVDNRSDLTILALVIMKLLKILEVRNLNVDNFIYQEETNGKRKV